MAEQQQDVDTLKRRGRRRLVGAVALVLLAVIVLPMVFDPEPRNAAPPVAVRIPGEDEGAFKPKPPPAPKAEKKPEPKKAEEQKPAEAKPPAPKPAAEKKAEAKSDAAERKRAEAALANAEYVVPVGAFLNPDPVVAKLAEAKLRYYTEQVATASGPVTRVRAGPFATRAEADKALETLKRLGFKPGNPISRSG
jgi:DedD protein